jgi:hypothetical protein
MMPAVIDAILVAGAIIVAIAYLVHFFSRKKRAGACCDSSCGKDEDDRIQIELPKDR